MEQLPQFFLDLLKQQYGPGDQERILSGYAQKRKTTFRINPLKATAGEVDETLLQAGISTQTVSWYSDARIVENADENALRQLPLYQDGKIYLQSLSSMLPPLALAPREGADLLDMTAAPGGKTTQMAAMSHNKAHITACEMNAARAERLRYNVQKQGASCVYVMQKDARTLDDFFAFDQILLDAPCSGSGTLDLSDPKLGGVFQRSLLDKSVKAQRALLLKAIQLLKKGQQMVYSTCSILSDENEEVISYALSKGKARLAPIKTDGWQDIPFLPVRLEGTVCVAPDERFEGFFLAKLEKK